MKRRGIQLSLRHRRWFYAVTSVLFLSGALWVLAGWLVEQGGVSAQTLDACQPWLLKIHGAAAMAFLVALGILIPTHVKRGWQSGRNRTNGAGFVTVLALLVLTGYGLYYFGDDRWRAAASWAHRALGFASPVLLAWHIWQGRRS
ncbi:MAG: hypothetical protein RLZZ350_948 [Verrucomicrobiota bacterium]|jgi:cation transport ATPase